MTATAEHTAVHKMRFDERIRPMNPDLPDPRKDPEWVLRAGWFYVDDGTTPDEAYEEFYQRHGETAAA